MNRFETEYKRKLGTVDDALSLIQSGDVIALGSYGTEPQEFSNNFHKVLDQGVRDIVILSILPIHDSKFLVDPAYRDRVTVDGSFFSDVSRRSAEAGITYAFPGHLNNYVQRWDSFRHPNTLVTAVTPMDKHGYFKASLDQVTENYFAGRVDRIIVEVNPHMPDIGGTTEIHISQVDCIYETDLPIHTIPRSTPSDIDRKIASYVAEMIHDGDTIQLGIGGIPDSIADALKTKNDLGIHTEMITNRMGDLIEMGVVNGRRKNFMRGKTIGVFAGGDEHLMEILDRNPSVLMMDVSWVNDPKIIARNDNMVSVNATLAVDLTGQCASESLGPIHYTGTGGQCDYAEGANHSKGGRSFICLRSTAKKGTVSTISAMLPQGSIVSLTRNNVDYIVTEYGVAPMRGRNIKLRMKNLISIAHPDFREQLAADAMKYYHIDVNA